MFKLNTLDVDRGKANADGIVRGWFDGKLVVDRADVIFRSTDFPKMKFNQFLLTPYFGRGLLPHEQTLWIDELAVATKRLEPVARRRGASGRVAAVQAKRRSSEVLGRARLPVNHTKTLPRYLVQRVIGFHVDGRFTFDGRDP